MAIVSNQSEHIRHALIRLSFWVYIQLREKISASFAATVREDTFKKPATLEPLTTLKSKLQEGRTKCEWQEKLYKDNHFATL